MKNKQKLLICGGTGFIGKNLIDHFSKKKEFDVYATYNIQKKFKNKNVTWKKIDLRIKSEVDKVIKNKDIVIQAAATTSGSKDIVNTPELHVTDNAIMNSIIIRACHNFKVKHFLFFSCTVMYPHSKKYLNEKSIENKNISKGKYFGVGNTKLYIEKVCEFFSQISHTKFTCIRHSNIYGPNDKFDLDKGHFFAANLMKILKNTNKRISIWGKGNEMRDMLYVDDLMNFIDKALTKQKKKFGLYNCTYGKSFKIIDIIKAMIKISKKNILITHDLKQPTIPINILVNSSKARDELKWKPKVNLEVGIKRTIEWMKKNY
jgi:nucleoside-diphosphate-sugar epimerase